MTKYIKTFAGIAISVIMQAYIVVCQASATIIPTANLPTTGGLYGSVGLVTGSNIVLIPDNITMPNGKITITGNDKDSFVYQYNKDNYVVDIEGMIDSQGTSAGSIRYKVPSNKTNNCSADYCPKATITIKYEKAAMTLDGQYYDIYIIVDDIRVRIDGNEHPNHGVALVYGNNTLDYGLHFGAFGYTSDSGSLIGADFRIQVNLYKAGTSTMIGKVPSSGESTNGDEDPRMVWGISDVDVPDKFNGDSSFSSSAPWAEHVDLRWGFYNIHVSDPTELSWTTWKEGSQEMIRFYHSNSDYNNNNKTSMLFLIDPREFTYRWKGVECGTDFISAAGTLYEGWTTVYDGSITDSHKISNNTVLEVHGPTRKISYRHTIKRTKIGPSTDTVKYYKNVNSDYLSGGRVIDGASGESGTQVGTSSSKKSKTLPYTASGTKHYQFNIDDNQFTVRLTPGQSKTIWQTLHYTRSNISEKTGLVNNANQASGQCTLMGGAIRGRYCIKLHRPPAFFTAKIEAKVAPDGKNSTNYVDPSTDTKGTKITSSDGSFRIRFNSSITRNKTNASVNPDLAGDKVSATWNTVMKYGSTSGSNVANTRIPAGSGNKTATAIDTGKTTDVVPISKDYHYEGTLKPGEDRTICNVLNYSFTVDASKSYDNTRDSARSCVKVYRDPAPCHINPDIKYGVHSGTNIGRIGVNNFTTQTGYSYTGTDPSLFKASNNYMQTVSIWARPGDRIKFEHEGCAGGQYAVVNIGGLDNATYKSVYTTTGKLRHFKTDGSIENETSEGYLFGEKVSNVASTSPLKYSNTKTWDSTSSRNTFLDGERIETQWWSPSTASTSTYNQNTYNEKTYSCIDLVGSAYQANTYQIAGSDTASYETDCNAYSKTGVKIDVGHVITQSFSWNNLQITNDQSTTGTYAQNKTHTAEANVIVPYNYNAQPYLGNGAGGQNSDVVYLGTNMPINAKIYVTPRTNTAFGAGEENKAFNTYATITKPTTVDVQYYYKSLNANGTYTESSRTSIDAYRVNKDRLNKEGNADGVVHQLGGGSTFNVPVPDSSLKPGDQVCATLTITPADSHNAYMAATVNGAGTNNAALKEGGSTTAEATICKTVAKLPTMSVESSNAYAGGSAGFVTAKYQKQFGGSTKYLFGSWSEYGLYGKVKADGKRGTASGATFGYAIGSGGIAFNQTRANSGNVATTTNAHTCAYSSQTFTNSDCAAGNIGSNTVGQKTVQDFRDRIINRFTNGSSPWIPESGSGGWDSNCRSSSIGSTYYTCVTANGKKYANYMYYKNQIEKLDVNEDGTYDRERDENGMIHVRIRGDAYLGGAYTSASSRTDLIFNHNLWNEMSNWTYIFEIDGDLVLDGNIKVGDFYHYGTDNFDGDPILSNMNMERTPIIFAKRVLLTNSVTRIDAVIIADELNTCAYQDFSAFSNGQPIKVGAASGTVGELTSDKCTNTVEFRAPVITKKLILNRTGGGGNGNTTAQRAEIFNMNMGIYFWSFNQMSRYNQAVTTYSRELPTRY